MTAVELLTRVKKWGNDILGNAVMSNFASFFFEGGGGLINPKCRNIITMFLKGVRYVDFVESYFNRLRYWT